MHCSSADAFHSDNSAVALLIFQVLFIPAGISLATGISLAIGTIHFSRCLPAFYELVTTQILLAEPLGSLAFKMVQVRQLVEEQQVKLEISRWVALGLSKAYVFPCLSCIALIKLYCIKSVAMVVYLQRISAVVNRNSART
ncbi:hypothetical protein F511_05877 [Dorcoceras hygrometricum]|uniref:Uncharacterized protein n=1 Tax=Dorcoceras hygrometricum TaxID=472368 RepID=A0A2Z7BB50_9LAMI|nr:hypothetical protein F511_05877 [Dorcoceras hygrometricum]